MASRSLKNVFVFLCFQIVSYQFVACQIGNSNTSRRLDLDFSFLMPPVCGAWNSSIEPNERKGKDPTTLFILGGTPVEREQLPWMALLGYKEERTGTLLWRCGGSLVSQRHVLTAAHCIHKLENELYLVRLGAVDISLREKEASSIDVAIKKAIKHELYDVLTRTDDIGLLILEEDVEFTQFIQPICLQNLEELISESFVGLPLKATIAGWGISQLNGPPESHLQMTQVQVVNNSICAQSYSGYPIIIDERVLCAGHRRRRSGPCNGDSGGPLVIRFYDDQNSNDWYHYQIGIYVSSGGCADVRFPGIYMSVAYYLPWIKTYMSGNMD